MTVYRQKSSQPLKWLVALVVFGLAMGVTFSDVYGYSGKDKYNDNTSQTNEDTGNSGDGGINENDIDETPTPVPEPSTLLLLAGGLGAMYASRRRKNRKK